MLCSITIPLYYLWVISYDFPLGLICNLRQVNILLPFISVSDRPTYKTFPVIGWLHHSSTRSVEGTRVVAQGCFPDMDSVLVHLHHIEGRAIKHLQKRTSADHRKWQQLCIYGKINRYSLYLLKLFSTWKKKENECSHQAASCNILWFSFFGFVIL